MSKKEYSNGEVTVTWEPEKCIHSENCFKGLGEVFRPEEKRWIKMDGASTEAIVEQVKKCPSGALGYYFEDGKAENDIDDSRSSEHIVEVLNKGPLMVYGNIEVKFKDGRTEKRHKSTAFCRCGGSSNKPFCDGTHKKIGFEG